MSVDKMTYVLWHNTSYRLPLSSRGIFNGQVYNLVYKIFGNAEKSTVTYFTNGLYNKRFTTVIIKVMPQFGASLEGHN